MNPAGLYVIVVGCGRLGAHLAARLDREGFAIRVVDRDPSSFSRLPGHFSAACYEGDPLALDVLKRAGIGKADVLIAATPDDDTNLVLGLLCKKIFATGSILACVHDPGRVKLAERIGIETVCSTTLSVAAFHRMIGKAGAEPGCGSLGGKP